MNRSTLLAAAAALAVPLDVRGQALAQTTGPDLVAGAARDVVTRQVSAVNAHDAAAVARFHASTAAITVIPSGKILSTGTDQIQAFFVALFKDNPNFRLTVTEQHVFKNVVVNHYTISGGSGSELISIYDVADDVIANEWVIFG